MPKFVVRYLKEVDEVVVGESREEVEAAAQRYARLYNPGEDVDWEVTVIPTGENVACHCGVVDGKMKHVAYYNDLMGTSVPEANE